MKTTTRPKNTFLAAGLCCLALVLSLPASAAVITWNAATGSDIGVAANWTGGVLPNAATPDTAQWNNTPSGALSLAYNTNTLGGAAGNAGILLSMTAAQTGALSIDSGTNTSALRLGGISIASGAGAFTLGDGAGTFNITLGGAAGTQSFTNNSANTATINSDVVLGTGGGGAHIIALVGTGNWMLNTLIGNSSGSFGLTTTDTGTVTLTGANTYTGATTVTAGTLTLNGSLGATAITVNPATGTSAILNLFGNVTSSGAFSVGTVAGGTGIVNVNSTVNFSSGSSPIDIGTAGFGTYNQTGGTVTSGQYLVAGITTSGAVGIMNISGGTYYPKSGNNGGTLGATAGTTGQLNMTGTGSYVSTDTTANGGAGIYVGENGTGYLNVSGSATMSLGGVSTSSGLIIGKAVSGAVGMVNLGAVGVGGGTITAMRVQRGTGTGVLNFHGGTLKAGTGANTTFMTGLNGCYVYNEGAVIDDNGQIITIDQPLLVPAGLGVTAIANNASGFVTTGYSTAPFVSITGGQVAAPGSGGAAVASIDGSGNLSAITIVNPGVYNSVGGITATLSGGGKNTTSSTTVITTGVNTGGGLTKQGAGTVTLTSPANYTGSTVVKAGQLVVGSWLSSTNSTITVSNSATLGVVAVGSSQISPTVLAVGNSTGSGTLAFSLNNSGQAPLTPGTLILSNATINVVAGNFVAGASYPLITYTTLGTGSTYTPGTLPNGVSGTITTTGNTISLNVTAVTNTVWTGLVNGTWDINTTANWTNLATLGNKYIDGSVVRFDDTGLNTTTITNVSGVLTPGAITVTNNTATYAIKTVIAGTGGITKSGTGTLTNTAANTYTGPTVINNGTVVAGVASVANVSGALGNNSAVSLANTAGVTLNLNGFATQIGSLTGGGANGGNVTNGGALLTVGGDNSSPAAFGGTINGTGGLTKIGTGTLTMSNVNTYAGATTVSGGTLALTGSGTIPSITTAFVVGNVAGTPAAVYQSGASSSTTAQPTGGGWQLGSVAGASGYYNLSGGTMTIQNGGEIDIAGNTAGVGTFGQFDMIGGAVNVGVSGTGSTYFLPCRGGVGESSVVNLSGGTFTVLNGMTDAQYGGYEANWAAGGQTNVTTISGTALFQSLTESVKLNWDANAGNVGILNLDGGTWQMKGLNNSYDLNVRVNFNGGTVKAGGVANTTFLGNSAYAYVYGGGGTVDNNGLAISITQPIVASTGNGITSIPVSTGGAGYVMPPQILISDTTGSNATAYAQISGVGVVTNICGDLSRQQLFFHAYGHFGRRRRYLVGDPWHRYHGGQHQWCHEFQRHGRNHFDRCQHI